MSSLPRSGHSIDETRFAAALEARGWYKDPAHGWVKTHGAQRKMQLEQDWREALLESIVCESEKR